jgi:hypothetical protein
MMHFTVEAYTPVDASCQTCCCEKLTLKPGTVEKVSVGYAPWAVPIGQLHCSPQFQIEQMETCPLPVGGDLPPQIISADEVVRFTTAKSMSLADDLRTKVADPEGMALVFKSLPLYGPKHGKLVLDPSGNFTYIPMQFYVGEERFYCSATDPAHHTFIFEVMIAVGIDAASMVATPHVSVGPAAVDSRYFTVSFPVVVTPAANECEVWRLTVLQTAMDCDCQCYSRTDCFDIGIAKCLV